MFTLFNTHFQNFMFSNMKLFEKQVLVSFGASGALAPLCTAQPCTYGRYRPVSIQKIFKIQIEAIRTK